MTEKQHNPCTCGSENDKHKIDCDVFKPLQRKLPCANCDGRGIHTALFGMYGEYGEDYVVCARCDGTGEVIDPRDRPARVKPPKKRWWQR